MGIERAETAPTWLETLIYSVGNLLRPLGFIGELGFRFLSPEAKANTTKRWLIAVYIIPHELSGGKDDGASVMSGFCVNLLALNSIFLEISTLEWRVPRSYTDGLAGPEVWLEGTYAGAPECKQIQLHVYAEPPADESPALVLDVTTNTLRTK